MLSQQIIFLSKLILLLIVKSLAQFHYFIMFYFSFNFLLITISLLYVSFYVFLSALQSSTAEHIV
ncbi:expressed protein, partial [Phakopsora pachyrhizi]